MFFLKYLDLNGISEFLNVFPERFMAIRCFEPSSSIVAQKDWVDIDATINRNLIATYRLTSSKMQVQSPNGHAHHLPKWSAHVPARKHPKRAPR